MTDTVTYRGNANLKKKGAIQEFTEEQVQEWIKCAKDPIYFAEKYVQIVHVDHGLIPMEMYEYQKDITRAITNERQVAVCTSRQAGKALSLDTPIPTPSGWKTMGELIVGDIIFGGDGKPTKITFATETYHARNVYSIKFDNGETVKADADHIWKVSSNVHNSGKETNLTTEQLIPILDKAKSVGQSIRIRNHDGVEYPERDLPIHPYVLGLWLGDGCRRNGIIYTSIQDVDEIMDHVKECGFDVSKSKRDHRTHNSARFNVIGLNRLLRLNGFLDNKHIPDAYQFASKKQRLELIRGLIDSDGSVDRKGRCEFYQKDEKLLDIVRQILSSLGIKVRKRHKNVSGYGRYFTLSFSTKKHVVAKLERKASNQESCLGHVKNDHYYIHEIEPIESVPVRCIQVDNKEHLFLCSKSYIPTHNTTTAVAVILHYIIFNEYKLVALLANKGDAAREILDRIQIAYEALPQWLQQGVVEWNKGSVTLENGCKVIAASTSSSAVRGKSCSLVYIDETAFVENWDEFFASVYPTISSGKTTKVLFTSTPKGLNHFYKICESAQKKESEPDRWNGYHYIEVPWNRVPGRDEAWRQSTLAAMDFDTEKFAQEFECAFMGSSGTLIDGWRLKQLVINEPSFEYDKLKIYNKPEPGNVYTIIVDVGRGKGLDYSTFSVIDITKMPYKQVATFRDNLITPVDFSSVIYRLSKQYNDAYILVEVNDMGEAISDSLHWEFECETLIYTENAGRVGKRISSGYGKNIDKGIRTTKSVKSVGCSVLKLLIEQEQLIVNDFATINELSTFSKKGVSFEAEPGCHDDMVMTLVLFSWMTTQQYFKDMTDINTLNTLRQKTEEELEMDMLPFGFVENGIDDGVVSDF
jgi:hypothetical protein